MRWMAIACLILLAGCLQPEAVRLGPEQQQHASSGEQHSGEGGWNIGAISIGGGAVVALASVALLVCFGCLVFRFNARGRALDVLVERSEDRDGVWKRGTKVQAEMMKAEGELHKAVCRVTKPKPAKD